MRNRVITFGIIVTLLLTIFFVDSLDRRVKELEGLITPYEEVITYGSISVSIDGQEGYCKTKADGAELIVICNSSHEIEVSEDVPIPTTTSSSNRLIELETDVNVLPNRENLSGAGGGYFGEGRIVCLPSTTYCQHEVGHALDDFLGHPSQSEGFEIALEAFIDNCKHGIYQNIEDNEFCTVINFPGVGGNPFVIFTNIHGDTGKWGGYGEAYASIFERSHTMFIPIPDSLNMYFME